MKRLTPAKIDQIAFAARQGIADPDEVREGLKDFYGCVEVRRPIPAQLIKFVAESFGRYLGFRDSYGPYRPIVNSLDSAFGLWRKKGRPKVDSEWQMKESGLLPQDALAPVPRNTRLFLLPTKPSSSKLIQIAFAARDGTTNRGDVCEALKLFCGCTRAKEPIPLQLIRFVAESFGRYLGFKDNYGPDERSAKSLDSAFGLLRRKGRPGADDKVRMEIAAAVLRLRLRGIPHQEALACVAEAYGWGITLTGKAFRDHLASAVALLRIERPFTLEENLRLEVVLRHQPRIESGKILD
jgi:hypothetical protein